MANGIDFVIGGKDQAKPAMASVEKSLERMEQKTNALGNATNRLTQVTGALIGAYAAFKGVMAMVGGVERLNAAYDQQAEAVKGLEVALKLQGASVDTESTRLQTFAGDMQKLTGVGDEVTIGLMRQAAMLGVNADQLDDTAKAAIGLSEATGKSLDESLKLVKNSLEGEFGAFGEIIPAIKTMATEEDKLAAVLALSQRGLEAKAEASNTVAGMSERASGAVGDLMESVGALLAPVRILISAGIKTLAESLQTLLVPAVAYAEEVLANIGPLMDWVKEKVIQAINGIIAAFTFFEVILTNLDSVWTLVVTQAELSMLQMAGAIKHTLLEVIPAYAVWFGENFITMLTGGFDEAMAELPNIAVRVLTEREKQLSETIGQVGANLGDQFAKKFAERMIGMGDGISEEFTKEIDLNVSKKLDETGISKRKDGTTGASINAQESRLLTRGPGSQMSVPQLLERVINKLGAIADKPGLQNDNAANINAIKQAAQAAAKNKAVVVPIP